MEKSLGRSLVCLGLILIIYTIYLCIINCLSLDKVFQVLAIVLAFEFFVYKLLTGWLISNLNVKIEPQRIWSAGQTDHLAIKLILTKGAIDSLWLKKIYLKVSEVISDDPSQNKCIKEFEPLNYEKRSLDKDLWKGNVIAKYTISLGEEVCFSAYLPVSNGKVIAIEVLVLGTRLFYGIESFSSKDKSIQWRASAIVLPVKVENADPK